MDVNQMLEQTGAIGAISRELGVDQGTAQAGAAALLPAILSGFQNPVAAPQAPSTGSAFPGIGGLGGLLGTISGLGGGGLLDNAASDEPTDTGKGNQILGQIFGSKDGSRAIAASASSQSGVEPSLLKKMLPILAMVAAGYVMKRAGQGGSLGNVLGGAPSDSTETNAGTQASGSGNILNEIIGAAGKFLAQ